VAGKIVKILVFINLVASAVLLCWAVSEYFTRQELVQADPAAPKPVEDPYADDTNNIDRLQAKIEALSKAVKAAQAGYARSSAAVTAYELDRDYRAGMFAVKLSEARTGAFKTFVYFPKSARIDVNQPGEPILGVDSKPVRGLDSVQQDLTEAIRDGEKALKQSTQRREAFKTELGEIDVLTARATKQKEILVNLKDEYDYLSDRRTDWDEQVKTLTKRTNQVMAAMARLGGK
jgi:hypothetical protein